MKNNGFTLIELIVVFTIFFIVTGAGMVQFSQFSSQQLLESSTKDVIAYLNNTRSSAASQTMLGACTQQLKKYSVKITQPDSYSMWAYCNSISFDLNKANKLPRNITFDSSSSPEISFDARTGYSTGGTIKIKSPTSTKTIQIDTSGNITAQ